MRVTERHGITALTLEAAAQEAGLTKPGLMYHFRTRDELLMAIQRHLTETWEQYLGHHGGTGRRPGPAEPFGGLADADPAGAAPGARPRRADPSVDPGRTQHIRHSRSRERAPGTMTGPAAAPPAGPPAPASARPGRGRGRDPRKAT